MPIGTAPRFCARGYGRFEKLLYGRRKSSRWEKTHVLAKMDIVRWTSNGGHRMVDIVRWTSYGGHHTVDGGHRTVDIVRGTSYVGHCTLDIVRWTSYVGHRTLDIVRWTSYGGQMFRTICGQTCSERSERSEHKHCSGPTQPGRSTSIAPLSRVRLIQCAAHA